MKISSLIFTAMKYKLIAITKDFLLFSRIPLLFGFLQHIFRFLGNMIGLSKWIRKHKAIPYNDFYKVNRKYENREKMFQYIADTEALTSSKVQYLEFGVCTGNSFQWWLNQNKHPASRFWGFDTFEGLPEKWLFFKKGDMSSDVPKTEDSRGEFVKGLFQATLLDFLRNNLKYAHEDAPKKIIHLDADLYSSTVFVLTSLAPYLKAGDIIFFDEFNVPNHEYAAWELFVSTYYVDYEVLGAVNNYYQVAIKYKGMAKFNF